MNTQNPANESESLPASSGRRSFLKGSVAAAAAPMVLTSRKSAAQTVELPPSPPVQAWVQELPSRISPIEPLAALDPAPTEVANIGAGECGRGDHQRFAELALNPLFYILKARENPEWLFNPAYPPQPVWGFQGSDGQVTAPGPTFFARYGKPVITRIYNELPQHHVGFGSPEISTHLHNAHTPSESDGFPGDFFSPLKAGPTLTAAGAWRDHFWPNVYAGLDQYGGIGDPREAQGTLFYHDHCLDFTAPNVLKGQAGFYLLFDDLDSGDEHDPNPEALRLPSHPYDYPIILQDKRFDADGMLFFDQFSPEGTLGDQVCVNGRIKPVLKVARRKYRLRILNGGPSRYYFLHLVTPNGTRQPFVYIANDGNLLPRPLYNQKKIAIAPAERADIVVDFSLYPRGTVLYLLDRQIQDDTRSPKGVGRGRRVLKLIVDRDPPEPDASRVPSRLRALPPISAAEIERAPVRRFEFDRRKGQWSINNQLFEVDRPRVTVAQGRYEIWELVNRSGGWSHPVHMHLEEARILGKRVKDVDVPIPPWERGRKDIFDLVPNGETRVLIHFRDFHGKYVMHCHNIIHEDHMMMLRFDVRP